MKKIVALLIYILFSISCFSQYYFYVSTTESKYKPKLGETRMTNDTTLNSVFRNYNVVEYKQSFPCAKNEELQNFYEIHLAEGNDIDGFEIALRNSNTFDAIYKCDYYKPACENPILTNDTYIVNNWANNDALDLINAKCAWSITTGDPNIVVAVIDTEFEGTHEDLVNTFEGIITVASPYNQDHGTLVTSAVACGTNNNKGIAGIGYNTRVKGYQVSASAANLWSNIWQAYLDGYKIINVSWTGIGSYPTLLQVQEMVNNGVVLVVAAGNHPNDMHHSAYANIPGVINVSGVDKNNNHGNTGHAHNSYVDVCAMSTNVTTCYPGNTYGGGWGTSFAAPQVSGVVALIRSVNDTLSPAEIENIIKTTADPIADANLYPGLLGAGRVNAYDAILASCEVNLVNIEINNNKSSKGCFVNVEDVTVKNGATLNLEATHDVNIIGNFNVETTGSMEIK